MRTQQTQGAKNASKEISSIEAFGGDIKDKKAAWDA